MQKANESTLLEEIVRGVKISAQLSALLVMAGCQGQSRESEHSILEMFARSEVFQQAAHLIGH